MSIHPEIDNTSSPLGELDVSHPTLYEKDTWRPLFARLRKEAPVHYLGDSANGPFWSVTSHALIKEVDANNTVFSSEKGGISIVDVKAVEGQVQGKNFIAMDEPEHSIQRRTVAPSVAPKKPGRARTTDQKTRNRHPRKFTCRRDLQLGPGSIDRTYGENANHDFGLSLRPKT